MIDRNIIKQYQEIDWQKLLRKDLGQYSLEEAKPHLNRIKSVFDDILNYPGIDSLSVNFVNQLQGELRSFIQFAVQIINDFKDTSRRQTWLDNIKNKEYQIF